MVCLSRRRQKMMEILIYGLNTVTVQSHMCTGEHFQVPKHDLFNAQNTD